MSNNDPLSEIIYSTVDFFLDFPKEAVDEIYDLLKTVPKIWGSSFGAAIKSVKKQARTLW